MENINDIDFKNNESLLWSIRVLICCFVLGLLSFISGIIYLIVF